MDDLLDQYRALAPDDDRDDLTLTNELGNTLKQRGVDLGATDPGFADRYYKLRQLNRPGLYEQFGEAIGAGIDQTQALAYGATALAADVIGAGQTRDRLMRGYQRNQQDAANHSQAYVNSYEDVHGFGDTASYVTGKVGELLPDVVSTVAVGAATGGAGFLARGGLSAAEGAAKTGLQSWAKRALRKTIGKEILKKELASDLVKGAGRRWMTRGMELGTAGSSIFQNAGETYGQIYQTAATREDRIRASLLTGSVMGLLDSAVPISVMTGVMRPLGGSAAAKAVAKAAEKEGLAGMASMIDKAFEGYAPLKRKFFAAMAKNTGAEGVTEALQEAVQEFALSRVDPDYVFDPDQFRSQLINAALAGAIGGGAFGSTEAVSDTIRQHGVNSRLNKLSRDWDVVVAQQMRERAASETGTSPELGLIPREPLPDLSELSFDADDMPVSPEIQDLRDAMNAIPVQSDGPMQVLIRYQAVADAPSTGIRKGDWVNALMRAENEVAALNRLKQGGIQNAEVVQLSGEDKPTTDRESPSSEEEQAAREALRQDGVDLSTYTEDEQQDIIAGQVEELRERHQIGNLPQEPVLTPAAIRTAFQDESKAINASTALTEEDKRIRLTEAELATNERLFALGEEPKTYEKVTPVEEQGNQSPSPVNLASAYSDWSFTPANLLEGRNLTQELAAGRSTYSADNKKVSSARYTRRAAVLRNTQTGEIEVRGAYDSGIKTISSGAQKGRSVSGIYLHGPQEKKGRAMEYLLEGWPADNSREQRPPYEFIGYVEFSGSDTPFTDADQAFFDQLREKTGRGKQPTAKERDRIDKLIRRRGGYGHIYETFADEADFLGQAEGRSREPGETLSDKLSRGEIAVDNPEFIENLADSNQETDPTSYDEPSITEVIDDGNFEPEGIWTDGTHADPNTLLDQLSEVGMPAAEAEQALDELDSIESNGQLEDIYEVLQPEDYPQWSSFIDHSLEIRYDIRRTATLIQSLYYGTRQTSEDNQASESRAPSREPTEAQAIRDPEPGPRRVEGEDAGVASGPTGTKTDRTATLSQRERGGPDGDPTGDGAGAERSGGEAGKLQSRRLAWSAVDGSTIAYLGDFELSVTAVEPGAFSLRIIDLSDDSVLVDKVMPASSESAAIAQVEAAFAKLGEQAESRPLAQAAPAAIERSVSSVQPEREVPADKPPLVVIQAERIPTVPDRVGNRYSLDAVGKQGVNLILSAAAASRPGFLLADGTGVGKSRAALAVANEIQQVNGGRVLYVTENAQQITKLKREQAAIGIENPSITFTTYHQVSQKKHRRDAFAAIIFDEAHNLKNADSRKAEESAQLKADFILFATATPMDKPEAAAYFIASITGQNEEDVLQEIGLTRAIRERKDGTEYSVIERMPGIDNAEVRHRLHALRNDLITQGAMIRREYPFYGERTTDDMELTTEMVSEQDTILSYWDGQDKSGARNSAGQRLLDLQRWLEPKKAAFIYERLKDDLARGRSVVVVAETVGPQWVAGLKGSNKPTGESGDSPGLAQIIEGWLDRDGIKYSRIYGRGDKSRAVDQFQASETQVAIMSPRSGGVGIDLDDQYGHAPRSVYVATVNFSGDVFEQIMGRFSRRNTMSPVELTFVTAPQAESEKHRAKTLREKLATLSTIQGKPAEDQDSSIRDLFSEAVLSAPTRPAFPANLDTNAIRTFKTVALPESRINSVSGMEYEMARNSNVSPFKVDQILDQLTDAFGTDAESRVIIRNLLEALPAGKLQSLDVRIVDDPTLPAGRYYPASRILMLNRASELNTGNGVVLAMTHEMGHFYVNEVIGLDLIMDEWQTLSDKQRGAAWLQYLDAQGVVTQQAPGDLIADHRAAQEWAAFQFTRIARAGRRDRETLTTQMKKEGLGDRIIGLLTSWYDQVREWFSQWIGDPRLSTERLDRAVAAALGVEIDTDRNSRSDVTRQWEYLLKRAQQAGYDTPESWALADIPGFTHAAREYRELGHLDSPDIIKRDAAPDPRSTLTGISRAGEAHGNRALDAATAIARGSHQAAGETFTQPHSFTEAQRLERSVRKIEAEALTAWATKTGHLVDSERYNRNWRDFVEKEKAAGIDADKIGGGGESFVYYDTNRNAWLKRNVLTYHQNFTTLLQRIDIHNRLFPEAPLTFEGIALGPAPDEVMGWKDLPDIHVVYSQPNITSARGATDAEVRRWLEARGWEAKESGGFVSKYYHPAYGVFIEDLHDENVLVAKGGDLIFIDPMITVAYPYEETLDAPAGQRNPDIRRKLEGVDEARRAALAPEMEGRPDRGKAMTAEHSYAAHAELNNFAHSLYKRLRRERMIDGDFESFYQKYTDTPITPAQAFKYLDGLGVDFEHRGRDSFSRERQRVIDDYILNEVYAAKGKLALRGESLRQSKRAAEADIKQAQNKLDLYQTQYNNAAALEAGAVQGLRSLLKEFKVAIGAKGGAAKLGRIGEIIRQLEGQTELSGRTARKYLNGMEALIRSETPLHLFDLLEAVADAGIDLKGRAEQVRQRFRDADIGQISELSNEEFAAVLAIAKYDRYLLDAIILRKLPDAEEKAAIVESEIADTKENFKRASQALAHIRKHAALKGRLAGQRALHKGRVNRLKKHLDAYESEIRVVAQASDFYGTAFNEVAGRVGGTVQGHIVDGSKLFFPKTEQVSRDSLLSSTVTFRYDETSQEDISRIIAAQKAWLDGPAGEDNRQADPVFYNQVRTQNARLMQRTFKDVETNAHSFTKRLYFDSLANSFEKTNTRPGRAIAQMLQRVEAKTARWQNEARTVGERADAARVKLTRALGYTGTPQILMRRFSSEVDTPMKSYMEQPGASLSSFVSRYFPESDETQRRLFRTYYEAEQANAEFIKRVTVESMQEAGLGSVTNDRILVPDYANDGKLTPLEQTHRNLGTGTFMIRPDMDTISAITELVGDPAKIGKLIASIRAGEVEDVPAAINALFEDAQGYDLLVGALARKDKTPVFADANGDLISREDTIDAYENSASPAEFFGRLYSVSNSVDSSEINTLIADNLAEVHRLYNDIHKTKQEREEKANHVVSSMQEHIAIDARKKDDWPSEWLRYRMGGATANNIIVSQNALGGVFGKNNERLLKERESLVDGLRKRATRARIDGNLKLERNLLDEIGRVERYTKQLDMVLGSQLGPLKDLRLGMELMNTLVSGVLNGPRAAMVQLNQIYQPLLHFGLSGTTLRMMKSQAKAFMQDVFGSFFESIGVTLFRESDAFRLQKELYGLEPEKSNGFFDFTADYGNEGSIGRGQRWVRMFNALVGRRGLSRASAEDALYTSFKPWAPFSQLIGALGKAPMIALRGEFDRLAGKAIEYADRVAPTGGDLTKLSFDAKNLGFRNQLEFDRLNGLLESRVGVTLADIVARHRAEHGQGRPFSRDEYTIISSLGLDLMASESNVFTTRSPQMHTEMGRFVFPLLGWAIHQPHHAAQMFKGGGGEFTKRTLSSGALTLGFGLIPAVMMMAMFEDWFDEYVMGKKRNLRPLTGTSISDDSLAVLERVTRNGMLGMPMEMVNLMVNLGGEGDLRAASLDQRVFLASSIRGAIELVGQVAAQKTMTWDSGGRRLLQTVGANGFLQQVDMFSTLLGLDNPESRTIARINASNYISAGGRMLGLETRGYSGSIRPTSVTPWVTKMQIAALANDGAQFRSAYIRALEAARKQGKSGPREAEDYIAQNWSSRHPLKTPFRTPPTPNEYQALLKAIGPNGARDVSEYVNLYNRFGQTIGSRPYEGKRSRRKATGASYSSLSYSGLY